MFAPGHHICETGAGNEDLERQGLPSFQLRSLAASLPVYLTKLTILMMGFTSS